MKWHVYDTIIGTLGLVVAFFAFLEARQAKTAANKAGKVVKRQSVALEISEICNKCKLHDNVSYTEVRDKYEEVNNQVKKIMGLYLNDPDERVKKILEEDVEKSLLEVKTQLNALNPINPGGSTTVVDNFFYLEFTDSFQTLSGSLSKLRGALEAQLIAED